MKKLMILAVLMIMLMPFVFSDTYTDFSRPFIQQKIYSGATGDSYSSDSYALRSTNNETRMDYTDGSWSGCSKTLVNGNYGGLPFSFYDSTSAYEHHSFLLLERGQLSQYDSNCTAVDIHIFSGNVVSQLGIINKGLMTDEYLFTPYVFFAYNRSSDSNVYMRLYKLDSGTSELQWVNDYLIGTDAEWGQYDKNKGMVGGGVYSDTNNPAGYARNIGLYSDVTKELFIAVGTDCGANEDELCETVKVPITGMNMTYYDHQLYYDDFDKDDYNEFIILGYRAGEKSGIYSKFNLWIDMYRIQPMSIEPNYYEFPKYSVLAYQAAEGQFLHDASANVTEGMITPCQIGYFDSEMEVCYYIRGEITSGASDAVYIRKSGFIYNNFLNIKSYQQTDISSYFYPHPFTIENTNNTISYCFLEGETPKEYGCYGEDGNHDFPTIYIQKGVYQENEILVTQLDDDPTDYEMIFSSGDVESTNFTYDAVTNTNKSRWITTFDNNRLGRMFAQDISGDGIYEFIYTDSDYLKIYSMNNTPWTFLNMGDYISVPETSTTTTTAPGSTTTTTNPDVPEIFNNLQNNIKPIIGLIIILFLCIITAAKTSSVIITVLAGIIGTVMSTFLGLLSSSIVVIMIIVLVVLMILGLTLFKNSGG